MENFSNFVEKFLIPGSISFLLFGLLIGVILVYQKGFRFQLGRRLLSTLLISYGLLSIPVTSNALRVGLARGYGPILSREAAQEATAVVVLGGGTSNYRTAGGQIESMSRATALRTLETVRVYHLLGDPWVIASGGIGNPRATLTPESQTIRNSLIEAGVPQNRILLEPFSRNTHEQALNLEPLLDNHAISSFVLVTSPEHIWRSLLTFEAQGLEAVPSVPTIYPTDQASISSLVIPSVNTLENSAGYLREYVALIYYWSRGWLTLPN